RLAWRGRVRPHDLRRMMRSIRRDQLDLWKIAGAPPRIACHQREARDSCVSPDIEIRERRRSYAATTAIFDKSKPSDEARFVGKSQAAKLSEMMIKRRHRRETRGDFGTDD